MKVKALTAEWCGKCAQAKKKLEDYDIDWIDIDMDNRGLLLGMEYNVTKLPTFILIDEKDNLNSIVTSNVLFVKRRLDDELKEN